MKYCAGIPGRASTGVVKTNFPGNRSMENHFVRLRAVKTLGSIFGVFKVKTRNADKPAEMAMNRNPAL